VVMKASWSGLLLTVVALAARGEGTSAPPAAASAAAVSNDTARLMVEGRQRLAGEQWAAAAAVFEQLRAIEPANREAAFGLGTAYSKLGRFREALPLLETVLAEVPDNPVVKNNLAWILAMAPDPEIRNPARAVRLAREAVLELRGDYQAWHTLAEAYYAAGRYDRALGAAETTWQLVQLADVAETAPFRALLTRCREAQRTGRTAETEQNAHGTQ